MLGEIDASEIPQLMVYNKIDLMEEAPRIERGSDGRPTKVWVSGVTGDGGDLLLGAIAERLAEDAIETIITLGPEDGRMRARFFEIGAVVEENICEDGSIEIHLKIQESSLRKIVGHRRDLLR